jgi:very-short-patch-repair endonuclease
MLARMLVDLGLPEPVFQFVVRDEAGSFLARADLAYPDARVLVEYDSYQEHTGKAALVRDSARRNAVVAEGWAAITATPADLRNRAHRLGTEIRRLLRTES